MDRKKQLMLLKRYNTTKVYISGKKKGCYGTKRVKCAHYLNRTIKIDSRLCDSRDS